MMPPIFYAGLFFGFAFGCMLTAITISITYKGVR